jgi:hypothetical protein
MPSRGLAIEAGKARCRILLLSAGIEGVGLSRDCRSGQ